MFQATPKAKPQTKSAAPAAGGEQKAIAKIEAAGGSVRKIAQSDDHVEVAFNLANGVTDDHVMAIRDVSKVVAVHLGGTGVTDKGLAALSGLSGLTSLHLENTKITDAGLKSLANLKELTYLNLYGTAVTDAGLSNLKGLTKLQKLFLWQTKATKTGAEDLKKSIPGLDVNLGWDEPPKPPAPKVEEKKPAAEKK